MGCGRRDPEPRPKPEADGLAHHSQGCLFRHDEIEGKGKIVDESQTEVTWQVEVFAAEAQGRTKQEGRAAYTDMARAAAAFAEQKKKVRVLHAARTIPSPCCEARTRYSPDACILHAGAR